MIFKRRDPKPTLRAMAEFLWPRGGWTRAFHYVRHRMKRLPDSPERIARGIWAGVFTSFTPFYGLHFVIAALLAKLMKGNVLAALMGTFFGNPLTYVPIGVMALQTGHFVLGSRFTEGDHRSFGGKFADAGADLWWNLRAIFTDAHMDWSGIVVFIEQVFYPYLIGGILPGIFFASLSYYVMVPLLRAYQKRRKGMIKAKFEALKQKTAHKADAKRKVD
ncbi:DNA-directed RNA polymerase subunit omega [Sulfitobacter alexandrii]|uniref:DNA-directed RNA polymerase subunit omega n=1 Tax=Sulfitobacter alexandrii TaxID=1917485 RepID=A0A1J0WD74_9RHOB|nr:DUF2062 domain-containing protein [Sulfitobacter alexandrii]APE42266.1 DNA-directed RNA polymerase subunit omega [Sulfitobacter alexandrii]